MIEVSAECGADVCKFQLFRADEMYNPDAGTYENESGTYDIYNLVSEHEVGQDWIPVLIEACEENGVQFLTTVCDFQSLDELLPYDPMAVKVASYEIHFLPLFERLGELGLPIIFSSAAATIGDVEEALGAYGNPEQACIMHCNGKYPTPPGMVNMNVLKTYGLAFPDSIVGFSDHTKDPIAAPVAAVSLGAGVVEKHFTLDRNSEGADHSFAVEPPQLKAMVSAIREAESRRDAGEEIDVDPVVLGSTRKEVLEEEEYLRNFAFRSLYARRDIAKGDTFTRDNVGILRAGEQEKGMHPRHYDELLGMSSPKAFRRGTPLRLRTLLSS
jgi:N-acetylneuraminate synthase